MKTLLCAVFVGCSLSASAADYRCTVTKKVEAEREYTKEQLKKEKFSVLIEETTGGTFASRCSFVEWEKRVTCDRYEMDRVDVDPYVKIKKMYRFTSQYSVQIFRDLSFVEDNGRGSIAFGQCELVAP